MLKIKSTSLALLAGAAFAVSSVMAQDQALIDTLIKKGILTSDEAAQIQAEAASAKKAAAAASASESKTIVAGKLYVDVTDIDSETSSGAKLNPSGFGLDVKRFYLGATHIFNNVWSANINTDSTFNASTGQVNLFIKTAFVQAKLDPMFIVQAGSANQPWIPFDEDNYGFRYVENTLIDRLHVGNSADWGVHVLGSSGMFSYSVAAVNGGGYKNPTRSKGMDLEGRVSITPIAGLTFAVGGYNGKLGKETYGAASPRTASRLDLLAVYQTKEFRLGAEYFDQTDWGVGAGAADKGDGYSIFGNAVLSGPWSVFGRYDEAKTSKTLHPNLKDQYYNVGIQYHVMSGIDIAAVYKHEDIDNPTSTAVMAKYDELGLFSQIAF